MGNFTDDFPALSAGINNLSDVAVSAVAANQLLQYNGTNWVNIDFAGSEIVTLINAGSTIISDDNLSSNVALTNATGVTSFAGDIEVRGGDLEIVTTSSGDPRLRFYQEASDPDDADEQRAQVGWEDGSPGAVRINSTGDISIRTGGLPGTERIQVEDAQITLRQDVDCREDLSVNQDFSVAEDSTFTGEIEANGVVNINDGLVMNNAVLTTAQAALGLGAAGLLIQAPIHIVDDNAVGTLRVSRVLNEADLVANQTISRIQMGRMEASGANPQNLGLITTQSTTAGVNHPSNVGIHCLDTTDNLVKIIAITPDGIEFQVAGDGVQFNQTNLSGTNISLFSQNLTHFEEGTFQPAFANADTLTNNPNVSVQAGNYQIVGSWCTFELTFTFTQKGDAPNNSDNFGIVLTDLPNAKSNVAVDMGGSTAFSLPTGTSRIHARISGGSNTINFVTYVPASGVENTIDHNDDDVNDSGALVLSGQYKIGT